MKQQKTTTSMVFAAMCIALGVVLPLALHSIPNAGNVFLPMHLPVLLCSLACGGFYGLACGVLTPVLSFLLTGMPSAAYLPAMLCELAAYGFFAGFFLYLLRSKNRTVSLYLSLILAMLAGRAVYGLANALIFCAGSYSFAAFFAAAFGKAFIGIAIQLVILPPVVLLLEKAGLLKKS